MAQDAELKLRVSLDLGYFRQQLAGLGQAAAGYNIPIQVKFDRRSVQNELNTLGANIRRRNYFLEVKTNLKQEIDRAQTLAKLLNELPKGGGSSRTAGVASAGFSQTQLRKLGEDIKPLYKAAAEAGLVQFDKTIQNNRTKIAKELAGVGQDSIAGLLNGLKSGDKQLQGAAKSLGKELIASMKNVLGIASPSKVFDALGRFTAEGFDDGFTRRFKEFKNDAVAEIRQLVALLKFELAKAGDMGVGTGIGAARAGARGGRQYMAPIGPLPIGSRQPWAPGTRGMYGQSGYEPYMGGPGRQLPRAFSGTPGIASTTSTASMLGIGLPALPAAGMSSAAGMRQAQLFAREAAARARSAERSIAVMQENAIASRVSGQVPLGGGGRFLPPAGPPGGGGGGGGNTGGFGQFGRAMGGISLPGAGTIRELGTEFSFAAKQVLLFGTAYKALAFVQTFPGQVGQAVGQLQSFRNTLNTISPSAQEAAASNKLILDLVEKYNVPLQSARDGFTKLYASMAPAGFAGNEIRDLFTGISKAAATFGMSADKVDRVNYAFAQMASKGQVMSEELKGQLGDVLPGAMALFAEAAGFKGPKAIQDFSAALEEGVYKGEAMRVLLKNVGVVMNKEFGPGAEGAAKTFQGLMNRMANSMQLLYESFEPVAVGFLNSVVVPLTSGIKQVSDGFNAFFTGTKAKTAGGFAFAQELEKLRPTFDGIRNNLTSLAPQFAQFGQIALNVAKTFLQIAGNPIVGYLAKLYVIALPLNMLFNGLTGIIGRVVMAMTTLNVGLLAGTQRFMTYRLAMQAFGVSAAQVSTTLRAWAPALNAATIALRAIAAPAILFGVSLLIERFMMLQGAINGVAQSTQSMLGNISSLANSGAVKDLKNVGKDIQKQISTFESLKPFVGGGGLGPQQKLTKEAAGKMQAIGLGSFVGKDVMGGFFVNDFVNASKIIEERLRGLRKTADSVREKLPLAERIQKDISKQTIPKITSMPEGEGGDGGSKPKMYISTKSPEIEAELNRRLAAVEANINLNAREKEIRKANLTEFAKHAIAKEELDARLLQIEKAGYVNRQKAIDDANAQYQKSIGEASLEKEKVLFGPILDAIEQETKATALAAIQQELYGNAVETNNDLLEAEYLIRTTLDVLKGKDAKRGQELAQILRDQIKLRIQDANATKYQKTVTQELLKPLQDEIALLRAANDEERRRLEILQKYPDLKQSDLNKVMDLAKVRDNIKQVRALIDDFVTSTSSDYKGFLKAVISGEDAADALQQFQEGLSDRVLTIFLDFTMKPVEDFFKNVAGGKLIESLFPKSEEEKQKEAIKTPMDANTEATKTNTTAIDNLTAAISGTGGTAASPTGLQSNVFAYAQGAPSFVSMDKSIFQSAQSFASQGGGNGPLSAFAYETTGFADSLNQTVDSIKTTTENSKAAGTGFVESLGGVVQGIGMLAGAAMGIVGGIQQIQKGGTKNTLAGIGSILMGVGGAIGGFMNLGKMGKAANGAVWQGGFQAFANGGMVSGPTLGLIGEGKYNEAIVPLPNGKAIPVQLNSDSIREKMSGSSNGGSVVSPMLSMNFETTTINNVEYVSRDQLERAMMETRKLATRDGARQGANLAIDKLQQSPTTRRKIGI